MKVKIGTTDYDLMVVKPEKMVQDYEAFGDDESDPNMCGFMCPAFNIVRIRDDIPTNSRMHTFIHECTHAMLYEIGNDLYHNEGFVEAMSKQIYGLFYNNNFEKIYKFLGDK